jgi:hypothetical protein
VPGHAFCPGCGFDTTAIVQPTALPAAEPNPPPAGTVWPGIDPEPSTRTRDAARPATLAPAERRLPNRAILVGGVIVAVALIVLGQLTRPRPAIVPPNDPVSGGQQPPGASIVGPPLIVGLTIQSPNDGQQVATKDVTVIGTAPPGLTITRDVSFGLDQHATADGTGHWAMSVGLDQGENKLKFRIGDDRSTEQTLRVIFTPQGG